MAKGVEIIGHRGYAARYPENTLASLRGAIAAGARAVEWDVHVAACGTPILFHDETLDRTTDETGPVSDRSFLELGKLDAGSWFSPEFRGTRIPSLAEAFHAVAGDVDTIFCEVKSIRRSSELDEICAVIDRSGAAAATTLITLDPGILFAARTAAPHLRLGWVVSEESRLEEAARWVRADGNALLDPDFRLLLANPERTRGWVEEGIDVACWTVDQIEAADALHALGVRRITTNQVGALMNWSRTAHPGPS